MRSSLSLLFSKMNKSSILICFSEVLPSSPFTIFCSLPWDTFSCFYVLILRSPKPHMVLEARPHQCQRGGTITPFSWLATLCLTHPRIQLALLAARAYCSLILSSPSTKLPRSLSSGLHLVPSLNGQQDYAVPPAESSTCSS